MSVLSGWSVQNKCKALFSGWMKAMLRGLFLLSSKMSKGFIFRSQLIFQRFWNADFSPLCTVQTEVCTPFFTQI